jgi:hypothetical protein
MKEEYRTVPVNYCRPTRAREPGVRLLPDRQAPQQGLSNMKNGNMSGLGNSPSTMPCGISQIYYAPYNASSTAWR